MRRGLSDWEEGVVIASAQKTDSTNYLSVLALNVQAVLEV